MNVVLVQNGMQLTMDISCEASEPAAQLANQPARLWLNMEREAGLPPFGFLDLRHTAASLMLNNGIPVIIVSRRLGHARTSITLDVYGHLIPTMQSEAAKLIDELVTPVPVDLESSPINM